MNVRFAELEELKQKTNRVDEMKKEMQTISDHIQSIEVHREEQMHAFRVETD
jgi:hypothetical protein